MELTPDGLRFSDLGRRCAGWHAIEDGLLDAGVILGPERTILDVAATRAAARGPDPIPVRRDVERRIDAPDGHSALLSTTTDGIVELTPVDARVPDPSSVLRPCRLDGESSVVDVIVR